MNRTIMIREKNTFRLDNFTSIRVYVIYFTLGLFVGLPNIVSQMRLDRNNNKL